MTKNFGKLLLGIALFGGSLDCKAMEAREVEVGIKISEQEVVKTIEKSYCEHIKNVKLRDDTADWVKDGYHHLAPELGKMIDDVIPSFIKEAALRKQECDAPIGFSLEDCIAKTEGIYNNFYYDKFSKRSSFYMECLNNLNRNVELNNFFNESILAEHFRPQDWASLLFKNYFALCFHNGFNPKISRNTLFSPKGVEDTKEWLTECFARELEKDELKKVEHNLNEASVNVKIYLNNLRLYGFLNKLSHSMENGAHAEKQHEIVYNDYKTVDTIPCGISEHLLPFQYRNILEHFAGKINELAFFYGREFIVEILDYPNNDVAKALKNMKEYFDNKLNCGKLKFYDVHDFIRMFFHPSITRIDGRLRLIDIIKKERVCVYTNVNKEKWVAMRELGRRDRGELIFEEASDQNNLKMDRQHTEIWNNGKLLGYVTTKGD